jgi:hypothetical protein
MFALVVIVSSLGGCAVTSEPETVTDPGATPAPADEPGEDSEDPTAQGRPRIRARCSYERANASSTASCGGMGEAWADWACRCSYTQACNSAKNAVALPAGCKKKHCNCVIFG